jgi:hypothetical protein
MSRSGYTDEYCFDQINFINWRGAVTSAIRGKRGQAFLMEMAEAMADLPEKKLIADALEKDGAVCAIGAVGKARGIDMSNIDPEDYHSVAGKFGIAEALAQEIVYLNDEDGPPNETPEDRYERIRRWLEYHLFGIKKEQA